MIRISFIGPQRKVITFQIDKKIVTYIDEVWEDGLQIMPKDEEMLGRMKRSHNPNLMMMVALILDANKGHNLIQYEACETDEDVAEVIRKDCLSKGLLEVK